MSRTENRKASRRIAAKKRATGGRFLPRLTILESRDVPTAFTAGNIVVVYEGDNTQNMTNLGLPNGPTGPVFLQEYNPSGSLIQTVPMPTSLGADGVAGNQPISLDGANNGSGCGQINLSADSSVLTFGGIDAQPGVGEAAAGAANRVIAQVGIDPAAEGGIDTELNGQMYVGDDIRAVVEASPNAILTAGHPSTPTTATTYDSGGIRYFNGISTTPNNGVQTSQTTSAGSNPRSITIGFDGRVYWSNSTGNDGINTQQDAVPTTAQPADVQIVNNVASSSEKLDGVFLADMNGDGIVDAGDRLYYTGLVNGLYCSVYNGTAWGTPIEMSSTAPVSGGQLLGLAGEVVSPTHVVLFSTTYSTSTSFTSQLVRYDDIGANPNPNQGFTTLQSVLETGSQGFRGVAFAPTNPTVINLMSSTGAANPGGTVTFTATVNSANGSLAGMTVNVIDNNNGNFTLLGQPTVQPNGTISFPTTALPLGANSITMEFAGSLSPTIIAQGRSNTVSVQVTGTNMSSTSLASAPNPSTFNQTVTYTAMVQGLVGAANGTVTFTADGAHVLGTATLGANGNPAGTATVTFSTLAIGPHPVTASYSGDANYLPSNGSLLMPQQVNNGATISVMSSSPTTTPNVSVTLTATVAGNNINPAPTGNVTFYSDGTMIGSGPVALNGAGQALLPISTLSAGSHLITATYNGDTNYGPVTSSQLIQSVQKAFTPGDLLVLRMGNTTTNLGSQAAQLYLDEYNPSTTPAVLVQSIALPNVDSGTQHAVTLSGSAADSGSLSLSANGQFVTFVGIDAVPGTPVVTSTSPATTPRTVVEIGSNSAVDTSTALTIPDGSAFGTVVGATTYDGQEFWVGGDGSSTYSGLEYATLGTVGTPTPVSPLGTSARSPTIYGGQLYTSSGSNSTPISMEGTGLPAALTTATGLPGVTTAANGISDPHQILFFNSSGAAGAPNLMYVADQNNGILKYYYNTNTSSWVYVGDKLDFAGGVAGITGYRAANGSIVLYGTGNKNAQGAIANNVFTWTDSAPYNANFLSGNVTELVTSANITSLGEALRGIAFVPTAAPTVASVVSSDGIAADGTTQRSEVRQVAVTFSGPVTFAGTGTVNQNALAAFQLEHLQDTTNVTLAAAVTTNGSGQTVVTLTFSGSETDPVSASNGAAPSLADGTYQMSILAADVTGAGGLNLNGGNNYVNPVDTLGGGPGQVSLFRLFGDATGNGIVDAQDLGQFRSTYSLSSGSAGYLAYLDADNSGSVDAQDLGQFRARYNHSAFN